MKNVSIKWLVASFVSVICCSAVSCTKNPVEQELKEYVERAAGGVEVKYKLIGYHIIDTVTYAEAVDSLKKTLFVFDDKLPLEEFRAIRNWEFRMARTDGLTNYEEEIMRGSLKDASPFYTELREVTEMADSLIGVWDSVDVYTYGYNYVRLWQMKRVLSYLHRHEYEVDELFDKVKKDKPLYEELSLLRKQSAANIFEYRVEHQYSIFNPLFNKRIEMSNLVTFSGGLKYKKHESLGNFVDMLEQLTK